MQMKAFSITVWLFECLNYVQIQSQLFQNISLINNCLIPDTDLMLWRNTTLSNGVNLQFLKYVNEFIHLK